ncbi:MAG: ATP-dependent protease subunit HslV [Planctomycetota bacterium]|nr:ATP-dependent protease subunit HslV [Planctomycetota bacterium]
MEVRPEEQRWRSTTVICVRRGDQVAMAGDGQVTHGSAVIKSRARKIRRLAEGRVLAGFAGSAADVFALLERFEKKMAEHNNHLLRAAIEMAKEWRMDRALRRLESLLVVADRERSLLLGGSGDVIEPDDGIIGIGSGGPLAVAAARALLAHTSLAAAEIASEAIRLAAELCIYTNREIQLEIL